MLTRSASLIAGRISNSNSQLSGGPLLIRGTSGGTTEPRWNALSAVILVQRTRIRTGKYPLVKGAPGNTSRPYGHRLNVLGECLGLPPGRVDELLWQSGFSAACDAGRYRDAAAVRAQVRRITGYADADEHLDTAWCSAFRPDPGVIELLTRHRGRQRGVFTNNGRWKRRS